VLTTAAGLAAVFAPRRVALVGASDRPGSVGRLLWDNLAGFPGEVVPVSQSETVGGARAYPGLREVPGEVDLAVVATPAATVPGIIEAAADKQVAAVVVLSGGFAEVGPAGARLQEQALAAARAGGVRLVGPNCFGVQNSRLPLNASIAAGLPRPGGVSIVTQSGAYGMAVHTLGRDDGLGVAKVYAAGNKADITDAELLAYLREDPDTTVIGLVLESLRDARAFFTQARLTTPVKPVIALLSGRTRAGQRAAVSHTAALATDDALRDAALRQAGVVRVRTGLQVLDAAHALASQPVPRGRRAAVITNSGGTGVELTDLLADEGLDVPELSPPLQAELTSLLPGYGSPRNPVDITTAWKLFPAVYPAAIELLARSGEVDLVMPVLLQRSASREVAAAVRDAVARLRTDSVPVPVYVCWVAPRAAQAHADLLTEAGVPCFPWPERAAQAAGAAVRAGQQTGRQRPALRAPRPLPLAPELVPAKGLLAAGAARDLLAAAGVPVIETVECATPDGAADAAGLLGFPVVAKVAHPGLVHKTDVGGVRLGLTTSEEVRRAAIDLLALAEGAAVLVQPQRQGVELVIGGIRDPELGPVVMTGLGGVLVETRRDVQFAVAPVDRAEAIRLLQSLRGAAVLGGVRGSAPIDIKAIADVIVSVGDLLTQLPQIRELDLNPVLATPDGCVAADWRILAG
jgi:acyl-CoA synthetase (NDP forming)